MWVLGVIAIVGGVAFVGDSVKGVPHFVISATGVM